MYRFVEFNPQQTPDTAIIIANKVNIQLTNLICFRRITSGMITLGTTPQTRDRVIGFYVSTPRLSDRIFKHPTLAKNIILHEIGHAAFGLKHPVKISQKDKEPFFDYADDVLEKSVMISADHEHMKCVAKEAKTFGIEPDNQGRYDVSNYEEYALQCFDRWKGEYTKLDIDAIKERYKMAKSPSKTFSSKSTDELSGIFNSKVDLTEDSPLCQLQNTSSDIRHTSGDLKNKGYAIFDRNDASKTNFHKLRPQSSALPVLKERSVSEAATCEGTVLLITAASYIARRFNNTENLR